MLAGWVHVQQTGGRGSISPTELVHEAIMKMDRSSSEYSDKAHVMAVASRAMRQLLADRARAKRAQKRGGDREQVTLSGVGVDGNRSPTLLDLDDALAQLEGSSPRIAEVVVMRGLGGMTVQEVAEELGVSPRTVDSDWKKGRDWLAKRLGTEA